MTVAEGAGFGLLGAEGEHVGTEAGRGVGDGHADQVGLACVGEVLVQLDGGVDLLLGLVEGDEVGGGFDLGEQGELAFAVDVDLFGLDRQYVAVGTEGGIWQQAAQVLQPDAGAVGAAIEVARGLFQPVALDGAFVGGGAFDGDTEPFGAEFLHGVVPSRPVWR
ncbi:hypothetical protein FQZ97_722130 [compost metagenome]